MPCHPCATPRTADQGGGRGSSPFMPIVRAVTHAQPLFRSASRPYRVKQREVQLAYPLTQTPRRHDEEITREMRRRLPDSLKLLRLKRLRLAVKDRLARLMRG